MKFARWVFTAAGVVGVLMIAPLFFLESQMAGARGPISHAENYYGFLGVTLAWQLVYLVIGRDPAPYRPIMLLGALGKTIFFFSVWGLYLAGRTPLDVALISSVDIVWAALFVVAWTKTRRATAGSP